MSQSRRCRFSTSTVTWDGEVVPWLAATGPLAYTPEDPPDKDYYFQYSWILPDIFAADTNTRQHYYFGAARKDEAKDIFAFWQAARKKAVTRLAYCLGKLDAATIRAPIAIYSAPLHWHGPAYLFMQHGSYQFVQADDQPLLQSGDVVLYRGVQESETFRFLHMGDIDSEQGQVWLRYLRTQAHVLSDSTLSFNSIHDRAKRCETSHIRDESWMSDDIARENGLDLDSKGFARDLWQMMHQGFSLARWVAENKFGPNYVTCRTPLNNIRLTTFFAGEHEVRIIDPDRVEFLETAGCRVECSIG